MLTLSSRRRRRTLARCRSRYDSIAEELHEVVCTEYRTYRQHRSAQSFKDVKAKHIPSKDSGGGNLPTNQLITFGRIGFESSRSCW